MVIRLKECKYKWLKKKTLYVKKKKKSNFHSHSAIHAKLKAIYLCSKFSSDTLHCFRFQFTWQRCSEVKWFVQRYTEHCSAGVRITILIPPLPISDLPIKHSAQCYNAQKQGAEGAGSVERPSTYLLLVWTNHVQLQFVPLVLHGAALAHSKATLEKHGFSCHWILQIQYSSSRAQNTRFCKNSPVLSITHSHMLKKL